MSEYVNIIETNQGVPQNNILFVGVNATERATAAFQQMVNENREAPLSDEDMEKYVSAGEYGDGEWTLFLVTPTALEVLEKT